MKPWTTEAQREWLSSWIPKYKEAQASGEYDAFWEELTTAWYAVWPEKVDAETGISMSTRLKQWMNNKMRQAASVSSTKKSTVPTKRQTALSMGGKRSRAHSRAQIYMSLYYDEEMAKEVDVAYKNYLAASPENTLNRVNFCEKWCGEAAENASDEVKAEIEEAMEAERSEKKMMPTTMKGEEYKPEHLAMWEDNIQGIPRSGVKMLRDLLALTGWVGHLVVGGPMPSMGGQLLTMVIDLELEKEKKTFQKSYKDHLANVERPFIEYLQGCYSANECQRRSLANGVNSGAASHTGPSNTHLESSTITTNSTPAPAAGSAPPTPVVGTSPPVSVARSNLPASTAPATPVDGGAAPAPAPNSSISPPTLPTGSTVQPSSESATTPTSISASAPTTDRQSATTFTPASTPTTTRPSKDIIVVPETEERAKDRAAAREAMGEQKWNRLLPAEKERHTNLARNQRVLSELRIEESMKDLFPTKPKPKPRRINPKSTTADEDRRRSSRLSALIEGDKGGPNDESGDGGLRASVPAKTQAEPEPLKTKTAPGAVLSADDVDRVHSSKEGADEEAEQLVEDVVEDGVVAKDTHITPMEVDGPVVRREQDSPPRDDDPVPNESAQRNEILPPPSDDLPPAHTSPYDDRTPLQTTPSRNETPSNNYLPPHEGNTPHDELAPVSESRAPLGKEPSNQDLKSSTDCTDQSAQPDSVRKPAEGEDVSVSIPAGIELPNVPIQQSSNTPAVHPSMSLPPSALSLQMELLPSPTSTPVTPMIFKNQIMPQITQQAPEMDSPSTQESTATSSSPNDTRTVSKLPASPVVPNSDVAVPAWVTDLEDFLRWGPQEDEGRAKGDGVKAKRVPVEGHGTIGGEDWEAVVKLWRKLESMFRFPSRDDKDHKLDTTGRPGQFDHWIKRARKYNVVPPIEDVSKFAEQWRVWWKALQPDWRKVGEEEWPPTRIHDDVTNGWGQLGRGGLNGFSMTLVGLVWWKFHADGATVNELESAVEEVKWALETMVSVVEKMGVDAWLVQNRGKKRSAPDSEQRTGKKRRSK